jgi:tRNA nucleotidyltransferase (CCA-adding enzyme)
MLAKDIMTTQVITVSMNTAIKDALTMMVEVGLSGLVVIDDDQLVTGVISERDMMVAYEMLGHIKGTIESFVNKKVVGVLSDTPVEEVSRVLVQSNVRRVPVIENGKCVGVISRSDILRYILKSSTPVVEK